MSGSDAATHRAGEPASCRFAVLTVSDSRTRETDAGGDLVVSLCEAAGHAITWREICPDDPERVASLASEACACEDVDALLVTGGTGVARRDATPEALAGAWDQELPGFGELFRMLSWKEVGAAAMLSRASAGLLRGRPVFSVPGSTNAVRLGVERLVLPVILHLLQQLAGRRT